MKTQLILGSCLLLAGALSAAAADLKESVRNAAQKLGEQSYTYISTPKSEGPAARFAPGGQGEGEVEKGGYIHLKTGSGQFSMDSYLKGEKAVVKTPAGWKTPGELLEAAKAGGGDGGGGKGKGKGKGAAGAFFGLALRNYKSPAEQAGDLADRAKELKEADGVISGDLTEEAAKEMLAPARPGGNAPDVSGAKGSVKFWVKDGTLTKFEFNVRGKRSFNGNDFEINRTTTIEIKEAPSLKITVPEEVKGKLE